METFWARKKNRVPFLLAEAKRPAGRSRMKKKYIMSLCAVRDLGPQAPCSGWPGLGMTWRECFCRHKRSGKGVDEEEEEEKEGVSWAGA